MDHYENFPVASWLCPPRLRPAISAIYRFARSADDIADEGDAPASRRLADLLAYRDDLHALDQGAADSGRWPQVFAPLQTVLHDFDLPSVLLDQLLDAFEQDVRYTASARRYETDAELLDYCQRSANPVGRLLLHLYGVQDALSLTQSDQICSALQLINFWQDLSVDIARARWYPSLQAMQSHAVQDVDLLPDSQSVNASRLVASYVNKARELMTAGAPLARRIPGRAGWELRLVVQGGLLIVDKIKAISFQSWRQRPTLTLTDLPLLLWRAWRMS
jgi:squalene synthase HpnC